VWRPILQAPKRSPAVYQPALPSNVPFLSSCRSPCSRFPTDRQQPPFWSAPGFSRLFIAGKPFRGKTSIKLVPLERYEVLVFSGCFNRPPISRPLAFPHGPPSVNRERQLVRAFTRVFKIKRKIIYTGRVALGAIELALFSSRLVFWVHSICYMQRVYAKSKPQMATVSSR